MKLAQSATANLKVRSAMNPLLWFCLPMATLCLWKGAEMSAGNVQNVFLTLGAVLVGAPLVAFAFFACFKPDYLRSETYQIRSTPSK